MEVTFEIDLKVKSLLRDRQLTNPNKAVQSALLEQEKQKWMHNLIAAGVRHLLPPVVTYAARHNKKIGLHIVHHCYKPLDDDNLIVSVNKFIVDSLVRAELLPDDCPSVFRVRSFEQVKTKRRNPITFLTFKVDPEDATGMTWDSWLRKNERTKTNV